MKTNRTRSLVALLGATIALWALTPQAQAAAPSLMTYQGRLKESGLPVTGTRSVSIFLCPCLSGACVPACTDTGGQSVSVTNGLFRTTFTVPSGVDLTTGQWYLEVQIGAVALAPREQITSSPYALYASSASTLVAATGTAGVSISTSLFVIGGGNVGIGTTVPATLLDVNGSAQFGSGVTKSTFSAPGALTLARDAGLTLSGALGNITTGSSVTASAFFGRGESITGITAAPAGANGQVQFNNTGVTGADANFFWDNANKRLGVGITIPAARLHVSSAGAVAGDTIFQASSGAAAGQELLVVKGDGRVGVAGVLEAAARLTLPADGLSEIRFPPGTNNVEIESSNQMVVGTYGGADVALKSANLDRIRIRNTGEVGIGTTNPSVLFQVGAGTLAVTAGGNVGIGTTSPTHFLDINGGMIARSSITWAGIAAPADPPVGRGAIYFEGGAGKFKVAEGGAYVDLVNQAAAGGWTDTGTVVRLTTPGDAVVLGNAVTNSSLTVVGTVGIGASGLSAGTLVVRSTSTASTNPVVNVQNNAGTELLRVQQDGNVGIGTTNPQRMLTVAAPDATIGFKRAGASVNADLGYALLSPTGSDDLRIRRFSDPGWTAFIEPLTISSAGNVGIGTTGPEGKLSVTGDVAIGAVADTDQASHMLDIASTKGSTGFSAIRALFPAGGNLLGTEFGALASRDGEWKAVYAKAGTGAAIALYTDGEVNMMNGNVGISTQNPSVLFQVGGGTLAVTKGGNVGIGTTNPNPVAALGWGPVLTVGPSKSNETPVLELYSNMGSVGGAVGAVTFRSQLGADQRVAQIQANLGSVTDRAHLTFLTSVGAGALTERMRIKDDGNVGIGTTDPTVKLHVGDGATILNGDVAITTGTAGGGSHLRSTQPTNPSAVSAGCGAAAPVPTVAGTDMAGIVTLNTGTGPTATCTVTVTFVRPYATAPKALVISQIGANVFNNIKTQLPTVSNFVIETTLAPPASTSFSWSYIVIE